jgi:hypothetical protein
MALPVKIYHTPYSQTKHRAAVDTGYHAAHHEQKLPAQRTGNGSRGAQVFSGYVVEGTVRKLFCFSVCW